MKKIILSIVVLVGVWWLGSAAHHAYADCQETSPDVWLCDSIPADDTDGVNVGNGNDTVTITDGATVSNAGAAIRATGNVTVDSNNTGSISTTGDGASGIFAGGNVSYSGNSNISTTGNGAFGIIAGGNVTVSGGTINAANSTGVFGFTGSQVLTITSGTITGGGGTAINADAGNDTVSITVSSVSLTGRINGNDGTDTLELNGTTDDQAGWNFFQNCMTTPAACSGAGPFTVNANGQSFIFTNFEAFINNMTVVIAAAGGQPINISIGGDSAPAQTTTQPLCEGAVKIFRQPNGDLDVYSGFDALPPNGFMIGRITQGELAVNVLHYQDPGTAAQLGWFVEVTKGDKVIIQVFDGQGNPIGSCTL